MNRFFITAATAAVLAGAGVVLDRSMRGTSPPPKVIYVDRATDSPRPAPTASFSNHPISSIPSEAVLDPARAALGNELFHDPLLSRDGSISCSSCHQLDSGGDDGRRVSIGVDGAEGEINSPTVLNSAFNFRQFWDGRARTLEEQIDGPIQHPAEMDMDWDVLIERLSQHEEYAASFDEVYGGPPTPERVRDAIASFERTLVTPDSPFDRYLRGETDAISEQAEAGYELFSSLGCITCHQGVNVGGNMFQRFGRIRDYFAEKEELTEADLGRFNVTGAERDRHLFKVPTLRNIDLTAPYFHDGSADTLEEAVQVMAVYQLGEELSDGEVAEIVAFLRSLTGEIPELPSQR